MTDIFTKEKRSNIMSKIKSHDTTTEITVKKFLLKKKIRPSTRKYNLPGKPDIILPKYNIVIFVHGCFWHQHKCPRGKRMPKTNNIYWKDKLEKNVMRDKWAKRELKKLGWKVIYIWECQIRDKIKLEKFFNKHFSDINNT